MGKIDEGPLISVIVLSYKSANTIVETLDSIYRQTYKRVELIIADDKSPDNSVEICKEWVNGHKERFEGVQIIISEKNTGTSGNCNRGCYSAHGEWLKLIAGDDLMLDDGLEKMYKFVLKNPNADIICGTVELFGIEKDGYDHRAWGHNFKLYKILDSAEEQYWYLLRRNFIAAMGIMMKRSLWKDMGGFDEEIPLIEDWPMWLKVTKAGHKIFFFDEDVAKYRLSNSSVRSTNYLYAYNVQLVLYKWVYGRYKAFSSLKRMAFLKKKSLFSALVYRFLMYNNAKHNNPW